MLQMEAILSGDFGEKLYGWIRCRYSLLRTDPYVVPLVHTNLGEAQAKLDTTAAARTGGDSLTLYGSHSFYTISPNLFLRRWNFRALTPRHEGQFSQDSQHYISALASTFCCALVCLWYKMVNFSRPAMVNTIG